jgi:hypothetical protein
MIFLVYNTGSKIKPVATTVQLITPPTLTNNLVHPPLLHPPNLLFERLHLAPAVKRPPVVLTQAPHHLVARALDAVGQLAHLPPLLELRAQVLNRLGDLVPARPRKLRLPLRLRLVSLLLGGGLGGQFLLRFPQGFGLLGAEALQLGGDAFLDLELDGLQAGDVGLGRKRGSRLDGTLGLAR